MDLITARFEKILNQETLPEVRDEGKGYRMWNDGSVEVEVGTFLYGLVQLLKPNLVLETGTYKGGAASYIAESLKDNGYGKLDTVEFDFTHVQEARNRIGRLGLDNFVNFVQLESLKFEPRIEPEQYDLMWLDTEMNLRFHELVKFFKYLKPGGYAFIHDMPDTLCIGNVNPDHPDFINWPVGEIPQQIFDWVKDGELRPMYFPNPRGLMGLYKPRLTEYKWK